MDEFVNKVANSGLITFNLEDYYDRSERVLFDIKDCLFMGLILKEKDFREFIKAHDWSQYSDKNVAITCTEDAIVPTWAYMLLAIALEPYAKKVYFGNLNEVESLLFSEKLNSIDISIYKDARIVIKGCGEKKLPINAHVQLTTLLKPFAKSIMYGEPCSTVPLYKSKT